MGRKHKTSVIRNGVCRYFLVPEKIKEDSSFPFDLDSDDFTMKIKGKELIISKVKEETKNE